MQDGDHRDRSVGDVEGGGDLGRVKPYQELTGGVLAAPFPVVPYCSPE